MTKMAHARIDTDGRFLQHVRDNGVACGDSKQVATDVLTVFEKWYPGAAFVVVPTAEHGVSYHVKAV